MINHRTTIATISKDTIIIMLCSVLSVSSSLVVFVHSFLYFQ